MKRQATDWKKINIKNIQTIYSTKGLVPRIYKDLSKLDSKKSNNSV